jgi:DNA invertase Pin-like site-specific DNA recombinase
VAVCYVRVSTDRQELGPIAQRKALEAWAARESVRIAAFHVDEDVSGASDLDARTGLLSAIADLRTHGAGLLAVARRDRLARSVAIAVAIERAVRAAGAAIATVDGRNDDDPSSRLLRQIEDAVAEHERALTSMRTKAALDVLRSRGVAHGPIVYFGFRRAKKGLTSKRGHVAQLELDPREQAICALIVRLSEDGMNVPAITHAIRFSVKGRTGHALGETSVRNILRNAPRLRKVFPSHAGASSPKDRKIMCCGRGHVWGEPDEGSYCTKGECKLGRGNGAPVRRIEWRLPR